jgi:type III secretion protein U
VAEKDEDKPFKPTARRLRKARQRGEVARSRDVTTTAALIGAVVVGSAELSWIMASVQGLMDHVLTMAEQPSLAGIGALARASVWTAFKICVGFATPVALIATAAAFAYTGPVFSLEPMAFKFERLNPSQAWTQFNRPERFVALGKAFALVLVFGVAAGTVMLDEARGIGTLIAAGPEDQLRHLGAAVIKLFMAAIAVALAVAIGDGIYQRLAFFKKQHMTRQERQQARREMIGDPQVKRQRRRLHQEWSRNSATDAARGAAVLVTNPTHLSVAIAYDPSEHEAPVVSGKGEDHVAMEMRLAAQDAGVPILRNIVLARDLYARTDIEDFVPEDLFTAVAEVIVWAREVRQAQAATDDSPA